MAWWRWSEEMTRRIAGAHRGPAFRAHRRRARERAPRRLVEDRIHVTGNTVIAATLPAVEKVRVNILQPGPGVGGHCIAVGGHCIAVDPWFIVDSAPSRRAGLGRSRHPGGPRCPPCLSKVATRRVAGEDRRRHLRHLALRPCLDPDTKSFCRSANRSCGSACPTRSRSRLRSMFPPNFTPNLCLANEMRIDVCHCLRDRDEPFLRRPRCPRDIGGQRIIL